MIPVAQGTIIRGLKKLFSANVNSNAALTFPALTLVEPTGNGIFQNGGRGSDGGNAALLMFYGIGAHATTANAKLIGWQLINGTWVPLPLLDLTLAIGSTSGLVGGDILNTETLVDTITENTVLTPAREIVSPANGSVAYAKCDIFGCSKFQVQLNVGTATSINCLGGMF